jgi:3-oxoacyl-[acyl-carrier protein] reductase
MNDREDTMKLKDKVAVITGGSRGLGKAIARRFLEEGAVVIITATKEDKLRKTAEELGELGRIEGILMNVSQFEDVQKIIGSIIEKYGRVDILVNNAGITADSQLVKMTEEEFDSVIAVNLKGTFSCTKAVAGKMAELGYGRIINISSVTAHNGNFGQTNYTASKAGVIAMTQTWAKELSKKGITVNAVAPGYTLTEMVEAVPEKTIDAIKEKTPVKRLGKPEEIAAACVFLSSDEAAFVTGAVLKVDGGLVL